LIGSWIATELWEEKRVILCTHHVYKTISISGGEIEYLLEFPSRI